MSETVKGSQSGKPWRVVYHGALWNPDGIEGLVLLDGDDRRVATAGTERAYPSKRSRLGGEDSRLKADFELLAKAVNEYLARRRK